MNGSNQHSRKPFWSWFVRSGRRDGATVSVSRRSFGILTTLAIPVTLCAAWYAMMTRIQPRLAASARNAVVEHPLCVAGIVVAFAVMGFRTTVLDYMAFRVYKKAQILVSGGTFGNESELRFRYKAIFGTDTLYHAPEFVGALSVAMLAVSGVVVVFSRR